MRAVSERALRGGAGGEVGNVKQRVEPADARIELGYHVRATVHPMSAQSCVLGVREVHSR